MNDLELMNPEEGDNAPGPRKTFWEHVDDLRKVLVRSTIALGVALVLCLLISDKLLHVIEYPLRKMDFLQAPQPMVSVKFADKTYGPFVVKAEEFPLIAPGSTDYTILQISTVKVGVVDVLAIKAVETLPASAAPARVRLLNLDPAEGFFLAFHVSIYAAIILSAPFWLYFIGQFMLPALHVHERKVLMTWLAWGTGLFFTGVLLTYFFLLPLALRASIEYSDFLGLHAQEWRADAYVSFVTKFMLGMGLGFQFPVVVLILVKMGLLTHHQLAKFRRHVIVVAFILGAVLTTPEVITQVCMAVPLCLLYEASIWIAWYWDWKKRKAAKLAGTA